MAEDEIINEAAGGGKLPSTEDIIAAIEKMGLDEAQKKELLDSIRDGNADEIFKPYVEETAKAAVHSSNLSVELLMLFGLISVVGLILAFFGYKLYRSLTERERRREEKRKLKQQKKKKN